MVGESLRLRYRSSMLSAVGGSLSPRDGVRRTRDGVGSSRLRGLLIWSPARAIAVLPNCSSVACVIHGKWKSGAINGDSAPSSSNRKSLSGVR